MKTRGSIVLCLTLTAWLGAFGVARGQDPITNIGQITSAFEQTGLDYPLAMPYEPNWFQPMDTWFLDLAALPEAVAAITNYPAQRQNGFPVWVLRLIQDAETGEVVLKPSGVDVELLRIDAPPSFVAFQAYNRVLRGYCLLLLGDSLCSYDDLIAEGYALLDPPRVVMDVWVVSAADETAYCSYVPASAPLGMFTAMADDESDGGDDSDPCSITNLTQPFFVTSIQQDTNHFTTITWPSCTMFRYLVSSADSLSSNTVWAAQSYTSYVWGRPNTTTWTDTTTSASATVTQRFYRVQRLLANRIAAGGSHSLALTTDSLLWAWGANGCGQLGDQTSVDRSVPVLIGPSPCGGESITNAVALAGGSDYTVAADATGRVWTWGCDDNAGQLGNGGEIQTVYAPSPINGVSNVVSVAAGTYHALALRVDQTVWAWGGNPSGQLGIGGPPPYVVSSPTQSMALAQIVAIAAGGSHSVALDANGNVWTWGAGDDLSGGPSGQLGNGGNTNVTVPAMLTSISNVIAIAAGYLHTIALTADKRVWTWGDNTSGELGPSGSNTVPGQVTNLSGVVAIAGGPYFTLAVTSNGQVYAFGDNTYGQLGTNGLASTNTPIVVAGISNAVLVSAHPSGTHSLAVTIDQGTNRYWGWGDSSNGQVGNGTTGANVYAPAQVQFAASCSCIQLGTNGSFTAKATGTLVLYFNDRLDAFNDNSSSYNATVDSFPPVTVLATATNGVTVGTVTNGLTYTYSATGTCFHCFGGGGCPTDANGITTNGLRWDCSSSDMSNFVCPNAQCYSLVGKIQ